MVAENVMPEIDLQKNVNLYRTIQPVVTGKDSG